MQTHEHRADDYWGGPTAEEIVERQRRNDERRRQIDERHQEIAEMPNEGKTDPEKAFFDWQKGLLQ